MYLCDRSTDLRQMSMKNKKRKKQMQLLIAGLAVFEDHLRGSKLDSLNEQFSFHSGKNIWIS